MPGHSTGNTEHLIRSELWSSKIKEVLLDELMAMQYVEMITDLREIS